MKCADCTELITEVERRTSIVCKRCDQQLHGECAMYSEQEDAFCERCHGADTLAWKAAMKLKGAEA